MANREIELHDSELAVLWYEQSGEAILIFRRLYIHESEGRPGVDEGVGWFQRAEMVIEHASPTEYIRAWPCEIYDGETVADGVRHSNCAPLPLGCEKSFRLVLEAIDADHNLRRIEIEGDGVKLTLLGERRGFEEFPRGG